MRDWQNYRKYIIIIIVYFIIVIIIITIITTAIIIIVIIISIMLLLLGYVSGSGRTNMSLKKWGMYCLSNQPNMSQNTPPPKFFIMRNIQHCFQKPFPKGIKKEHLLYCSNTP